MRSAGQKIIIVLISLTVLTLFSGCADWKKRHDALYVEHQNLQGRLEAEKDEKNRLAQQITQDQHTIDELREQIDELNRDPGEVTGFGPGVDVKFDAASGTITVTLPTAILFDSGEVTLKRATIAELDHIQTVLKSNYSGREVDVVGHTDTDPIKKSSWKDNLELSAQRALAVTRYLIKQGIPEDKIRAVGCGQARPVESNATVAGKAKNRRVEIVVHLR